MSRPRGFLVASVVSLALPLVIGCGLPGSPARTTVQEQAFSFQVPRDWYPAVHDEAAGRFVPMKGFRPGSLRPGGTLAFASPQGDFIAIELDPLGHGSEGDLRWTVESRDDRFVLLKEGALCTPPPRDLDEMDACRAGDGRLDIEIMPLRLELRGHAYVLHFGNALREQGVDVQVYREILASFRAR